MVIAIIAILAAMLLPALSKARAMAKAAVCINNLKQVGIGLLLYAENWDGIFYGSLQETTMNRDYIPVDVRYCPAWKPFDRAGDKDTYKRQCYGLRGGYVYPGLEITNSYVKTRLYAKVQAHAFWILADSINMYYPVGNTSYRTQWSGVGNTSTGYGFVHFRHGNNANLLFVDGHVESVTMARFREVTLVHSWLTGNAADDWWVVDRNLNKVFIQGVP